MNESFQLWWSCKVGEIKPNDTLLALFLKPNRSSETFNPKPYADTTLTLRQLSVGY